MAFQPKLWLGVGAFALAGTVNPATAEPAIDPDPSVSATPARAGSQNQTPSRPVALAQLRDSGGEGGRAEKGGGRRTRVPRLPARWIWCKAQGVWSSRADPAAR